MLGCILGSGRIQPKPDPTQSVQSLHPGRTVLAPTTTLALHPWVKALYLLIVFAPVRAGLVLSFALALVGANLVREDERRLEGLPWEFK